MKTIIAGSRWQENYKILEEAIKDSGIFISEVVSGCARGPDIMGLDWAQEMHIPVKKFRAEWHRYGMSAGPRRNTQMAEYADALIAIWDGKSRGTKNMIDQANRLDLKVYVHLAS